MKDKLDGPTGSNGPDDSKLTGINGVLNKEVSEKKLLIMVSIAAIVGTFMGIYLSIVLDEHRLMERFYEYLKSLNIGL